MFIYILLNIQTLKKYKNYNSQEIKLDNIHKTQSEISKIKLGKLKEKFPHFFHNNNLIQIITFTPTL